MTILLRLFLSSTFVLFLMSPSVFSNESKIYIQLFSTNKSSRVFGEVHTCCPLKVTK